MKYYNTYSIYNEEAIALLSKRVDKKKDKEVDSVEFEREKDGCCYVFTLKSNEESDGFVVSKTILMTGDEACEFFKNYVSKKYQEKVVACDQTDDRFVIRTETQNFEETE